LFLYCIKIHATDAQKGYVRTRNWVIPIFVLEFQSFKFWFLAVLFINHSKWTLL
jgi:hypothetical protein